jgi:hypothetical protein
MATIFCFITLVSFKTDRGTVTWKNIAAVFNTAASIDILAVEEWRLLGCYAVWLL